MRPACNLSRPTTSAIASVDSIGQRADAIAHILVDVAGNFTDDCRRALRLQGTARAVALAGSVVDDVTLIDVAGAGQLRTARADVDIALPVEDEVGPTEGTIGPG